jgi:hypothetical protein
MPQRLTDAAFRAEARRQSQAVAASPREREDQDFVDAISELAFDEVSGEDRETPQTFA